MLDQGDTSHLIMNPAKTKFQQQQIPCWGVSCQPSLNATQEHAAHFTPENTLIVVVVVLRLEIESSSDNFSSHNYVQWTEANIRL